MVQSNCECLGDTRRVLLEASDREQSVQRAQSMEAWGRVFKRTVFLGMPVGWVLPASSHLQQCLVSKGHDALKDDDICTI